MFVQSIAHERLREVLHYDPETGLFTWKVKVARKIMVGRVAGSRRKGYWRVAIDGEEYAAHRLAWFYMTGAWPEQDIDHRDLDPMNNAWANLRQATQGQNNANTRARNALGIKGVRRSMGGNRFVAEITLHGRGTYLGIFETVEEARRAYAAAAKDMHGEFARAA